MRTLMFALLVSTSALASDYSPDPENGVFLHGDHCVECHRVENHEALYTR